MKKIFNLILAALVIIGAASCTKNEEVAYQGGESLSFYAEIVNGDTRAYIDDTDGDKTWNTIWEEGDQVRVLGKKAFIFTYGDGKFTCTADGVTSLIGQSVTIDPVSSTLDSKAGKYGWNFNGTFTTFAADMTVQLEANMSYFRYTYTGAGEVTITVDAGTSNVFIVGGTATNTITFAAIPGENFVPFWTKATKLDATLSYSIDDVKCKQTAITLYRGKVYNLGTLTVPEWGIAGSHNSWTAATMYQSGGYYVAQDVPAGTEFKFKKNDIWKGTISANAKVSANTWSYFNNGGSNFTLPSGSTTYDIYMSRENGVFCVVQSGAELSDYVVPTGKAIYLNAGGSSLWDQGGAYFEAWAWPTDADGAWYTMADVEDGIYRCIVPSNVTSIKILRKSSAEHASYDWKYWNETDDLSIPTGKNLYTITGWNAGDGNWSTK